MTFHGFMFLLIMAAAQYLPYLVCHNVLNRDQTEVNKILVHVFFRAPRINYCNVLSPGLTTSGQAMFDIIRSAPVSLPIPDQTRPDQTRF